MRNRYQPRLIVGCLRSIERPFIVAASAVFALLLGATFTPAQQDIAGAVEQARGSFKPVSEQQVSEARAELRKRMNEIEQFVQPSSKNGQRWMRYLHWDTLKEQVNADESKNFEAVDATLGKLNQNVSGLEHRRFRTLAKALRRYRDTLAVSMWEKPADLYNRQLDALQHDLDAYHKEPSSKTGSALSERIRIIDSIGQAPKLLDAVRGELAQPNAFVNVSTSLLAAGVDPVDRFDPVTDCILGTSIQGDAHTTGSVGVASIPSNNKAVLEFISKGHTWSQNVGYNGPAVIRSTADSDYTATKRVELADPAFIAHTASVSAETDTHIHSVAKKGGGFGSGLVAKIGWKKARQSEGQVEAIASDHAEDRIADRFNDEVDDQVQKLRKRYEDDYRRPLERRGDVPDHIRFSSDKKSLALEVTQANRSQLGASGGPPAATEAHEVTMRLHETAVNNYSASILGGATASQTKADEDIKFNVEIPAWMKDLSKKRKTEATEDAAAKAEPFKEYAMTLRDSRPISVNFAGGKVKVTLHITDLKSGEKSFTDWDVTGTYTPELSNGGVTLHREGKLEMLPADFSGRLDRTQTAERSNLEKELEKRSDQGKGFPKSIQVDPVQPEGKLADVGPLEYREFSSGDGWLVVGLDRQSKRSK